MRRGGIERKMSELKIEIMKPTVLGDLLSCVAVLKEEVNIKFNNSGLSIATMNDRHEAMVELKLPPSFFEGYHVGGEEKICINLKELLARGFKKPDSGEELFITKDTEKNQLVLNYRRGGTDRAKFFPLPEPIDEEVPVPKIFFKVKAQVFTGELCRVINDIAANQSHIAVTINDKGITFSGKGDYEEKTLIGKGADALIKIECEEESTSTYTSEYLVDILKNAKKVSEIVSIELSTDMPIKIGPELPRGRLVYHLAPCIGV